MGQRTKVVVAVLGIAVAVPVALAIPAAICRPEGGELPGINCLPLAGLALPGAWLFALVLGAWLGSREPAVTRITAAAAVGGLAVGTYAGLRVLAGGEVAWLHGAVNAPLLALPLLAFGAGGLAAGVVGRRARHRRSRR